jgi:hypothetical protein
LVLQVLLSLRHGYIELRREERVSPGRRGKPGEDKVLAGARRKTWMALERLAS